VHGFAERVGVLQVDRNRRRHVDRGLLSQSGEQPQRLLAGLGSDLVGVDLEQGGVVRLWRNQRDGTFAESGVVPCGKNPYRSVAADFNGDGFLDVVAGSNDGQPTSLLLGRNGGFGPASSIANVSGPMTTGDWNGDGNTDIAITSGYNAYVLEGAGDGTFPATTVWTSAAWLGAPMALDFNDDGKLDLVGTSNAPSFTIWLQ